MNDIYPPSELISNLRDQVADLDRENASVRKVRDAALDTCTELRLENNRMRAVLRDIRRDDKTAGAPYKLCKSMIERIDTATNGPALTGMHA